MDGRSGAEGRRPRRPEGPKEANDMRQAIRLQVELRDAWAVRALRAQVQRLQADSAALLERCNRAEFRLRCEYSVNEQLLDLCRSSGVTVPKRLKQRPW